MQNSYEFNGLQFITAGGLVSMTVATILIVMSVTSWYLIVTKAYGALQAHKAIQAYSQQFWSAGNLAVAIKQDGSNAASRLAKRAIAAAEHYLQQANNNDMSSKDEFVARVMNRSIAEENAEMERGLTVLASVGSVSPFVGLFGTVWGIYHALASISQSGQATLDKVAGPVGEALIMTALGLAVAIPAVLAYNALVRNNRILISSVEHFADELHTLLTTGAVINTKIDVTKVRNTKDTVHVVEVTV
ncbi:MAG: MotA/TolQ/ExbB proton channel family protein [Methylotenera sp.]|nr:MotA/TolQ/ExbB proton channel family protein [Methylotenera sp.]